MKFTEDVRPLISVVMPSYNAEKYISEAIQSVLAQTYENLELLVIDDGSTDSTADIVRRFSKIDSRVTLYMNSKNIGVALTRNRGMDLAKGSWIALLDSDDVWHKDKLEKQVALAEKTGADIIYCSYFLTDENGKRISEFIVPSVTSYEEMLKCSVIGCSTAMFCSTSAGRYRFTNESFHEDYVFWLNLLRNGFEAVGCEEPLLDYRVVENSRSYNKIKSAKNRWIVYREVEKLSLKKAVCAFVSYTYNGIRKYKRL